MRVSANELLVQAKGDLRQTSVASLLEQQREEKGLKQEIAELVEELLVLTGDRGVGNLVGLLDRVRDDRSSRLSTVPRALLTKPHREVLKVEERAGEAVGVAHFPLTYSVVAVAPDSVSVSVSGGVKPAA